MSQMVDQRAAALGVSRMLRCKITHRYFTGGGWTDNRDQAQRFTNVEEAVRACVCHGLQNVELVLHAPGGGAELFVTTIR